HNMLVQSEAKFRLLAEKSPVGIYIIQDNVIKYINPQFALIFGYSPEELLEIKSIPDLVFSGDRRKVEEHFLRAADDGGDLLRYQFRGVRKEGEVIHLESYDSATLYYDRPAILGTTIDITDRKRSQEELLKRRKLESIGILAGGIAHDFNNLLMAIKGNIGILKFRCSEEPEADMSDESDMDLPETGEVFQCLDKATSQAADLAQKLITFSDGGWLMREKITLPNLLQTAVDYLPELKGNDFDVDLDTDLEPIYVDEHQFRQVLQALLLNAVEAVLGKSPIFIRAHNVSFDSSKNKFLLPAGEYIEMSIRDSGVGIPRENMEKIYDPYFSTKETYDQKGLGLGLTICYSVIKKHAGHIVIESDTENGTLVTLYVPAFTEETVTPFGIAP
ncbi:MAG: PAS domain S-box protein, partial [bacterium]|nr:PAS domain S-box protein [bacterium]